MVAGVLARRAGLARGRPPVHRGRGGAGRRHRRARWASSRSCPKRSPPARSRLLDPAIGGLELGLAVVGGVLTAAYVARLLGAPVGRWATTLALPLLVALGAGKLSMALGGSGQGAPLDAAWATAYLGPGPWGSLAPGAAIPSVPAVRGLRHLDPGPGPGHAAVGFGSAVGSGARDGRLLLIAWRAGRRSGPWCPSRGVTRRCWVRCPRAVCSPWRSRSARSSRSSR